MASRRCVALLCLLAAEAVRFEDYFDVADVTFVQIGANLGQARGDRSSTTRNTDERGSASVCSRGACVQ